LNKSIRLKVVILLILIFSSTVDCAQTVNQKLKLYGDVRFRSELDWDSQRADGTFRTDRARLRYRLRFGFKYKWDENVEFGGRVRSGNPLNQQSPQVSFGNEFQPTEISIDKVFIKYEKGNYWIWGGENGFPFWTQNELFWDEDVNPEGIAMGSHFNLNDRGLKLTSIFGYFIPSNSAQIRGDQARSFTFQMNIMNATDKLDYVLSSGIFSFKDMPNTPDNTSTFLLDYAIWTASLQLKPKNSHFTFGVDYFNNLVDYNKNASINPVFINETTAYVFNVNYGSSKKKGDILLGYYYSYIGKYAVIDYFAQDDWLRWGTVNYNRSSNFKGSEFRFMYTMGPNFNLVLRGYLVKAIRTIGTALESGNRLRLDFNIKF